MNYDYWFNNLWFQTTELDVFGGQYVALWDENGCFIVDTKQVLSGPAPAPVPPGDYDDECPF